jgi:hypothetical protein
VAADKVADEMIDEDCGSYRQEPEDHDDESRRCGRPYCDNSEYDRKDNLKDGVLKPLPKNGGRSDFATASDIRPNAEVWIHAPKANTITEKASKIRDRDFITTTD